VSTDPFAQLKAVQREAWALFAPQATFTIPPAAALVEYAGVRRGDQVLDVACGTGVVAITAARVGASVRGLDLAPALLDDARHSAGLIGANIEFMEGDVEAMPYADAMFDVVLSQFGHMFAPRPDVAIAEMLRVLKPGGRIAFSTWPPELLVGRMFFLVEKYLPPPAGAAPPSSWGDPNVVRQRLGDIVEGVEFNCEEMLAPTLSPQHYRAQLEITIGPIAKTVSNLATEPSRLAQFRSELELLIDRFLARNQVHQSYLMTRAIKTKH
jgi:SAM-dependent methyltransferase